MTSNSIDTRGTTRAIAAAMQGLERRFEVVADNLANLETAGHKRLVAYSHHSSDEGGGAEGPSRQEAVIAHDFTQGDLVQSDDFGDLALKGEGFFAVEVEDKIRFVRSVALSRDPEGTVLDSRGARLLGEAGPLRTNDPNDALRVERDGTVLSNGEAIGRLRVVTFVDPTKLLAEGGGRYAAPEGTELVAATSTEVLQGFRERSNTDPVRELVEMIVVQRQYQAAQKALTTESELRQRLNELSR